MKAEKPHKSEVYERCLREITQVMKHKAVSEKMKIVCAVLKKRLPYYFWVGFYFPRGDFLELGPSIGPPACTRIALTGVCGKATENKEPIVVPDVREFPGHVVCDPRSRSDIALPVFDRKGRVIAVFDVDSEELNSFDETDRKWLERILRDVFSV